MLVVVAGHVDHGKSTLVGRLLADSGSLPDEKMAMLRRFCEKNGKPFEYAHFLDALKDEQAKGVTIQSARVFLRTPQRDYQLIDSPGHVEFLKNMVSGASRADAALLVVDAEEGLRENTRRHAYILSYLGIRPVVVLINKMDLVDYSARKFRQIEIELLDFFQKQAPNLAPRFIPISAYRGENVVARAKTMAWYEGPTVLEALEELKLSGESTTQATRVWIQDVYRFQSERPVVAGWIASGSLRDGDALEFSPSGRRARVREVVEAGANCGFRVEGDLPPRGEIVSIVGERRPHVAESFRANVMWLGKNPLAMGKTYGLRLGTARTRAEVTQVHRVLNTTEWRAREDFSSLIEIAANEVAECTVQCEAPIAFDSPEENAFTSRFVLVDDYEIQGGGIILV